LAGGRKLKRKVLIFVAFVVLSVNAYAQTAFDYLKDSLVNVLTLSTIVQVADYEYDGDKALWGTYLEPGKNISLSAQFDAGVEYLMLSSAHTTKADIDLKVYQGRGTGGTVVAKDTAPDAAPLVRFTPASSGWYCFELLNSSNIPAFVSLVILKKKPNANFSFTTLVEALANTLEVAQYLSTLLPRDSEIPANRWTLFGGNIRKGGNAGYYNTQLSKGTYILVGSGENSVTNCDVEVIEQYANNNTEGRGVSQNTDSRFPFDFAVFSPSPSKYHYLKVINESSRNDNAFMFGFLILMP
jgi:hypothetical protein